MPLAPETNALVYGTHRAEVDRIRTVVERVQDAAAAVQSVDEVDAAASD